jgi:hypothetical protein
MSDVKRAKIESDGWHPDPFGIHDERLFRDGEPTPLVKDGGVGSVDTPPAARMATAPLPSGNGAAGEPSLGGPSQPESVAAESVSPGPGWWRASDGNWYRPEQHPHYRPPPPPPPPPSVPPTSTSTEQAPVSWTAPIAQALSPVATAPAAPSPAPPRPRPWVPWAVAGVVLAIGGGVADIVLALHNGFPPPASSSIAVKDRFSWLLLSWAFGLIGVLAVLYQPKAVFDAVARRKSRWLIIELLGGICLVGPFTLLAFAIGVRPKLKEAGGRRRVWVVILKILVRILRIPLSLLSLRTYGIDSYRGPSTSVTPWTPASKSQASTNAGTSRTMCTSCGGNRIISVTNPRVSESGRLTYDDYSRGYTYCSTCGGQGTVPC